MIYPIPANAWTLWNKSQPRCYPNMCASHMRIDFFFFWWIKTNREHFYCFHCSSNPIDLAKWVFRIPFCRQHLFKLTVTASSVVLLALKNVPLSFALTIVIAGAVYWTHTVIPLVVVVDIQLHFHWKHWSNIPSMHAREYEFKEVEKKITPNTVFFRLAEVTSVTTITS